MDLSQKVGEFIYKIIDPILEHFWGLYAVEYCDDEELEEIDLRQLKAGQGSVGQDEGEEPGG